MSYNEFAGYHCPPQQQLSTAQLSLMTSNSNASTEDSPCCSSTGGTDSRNTTQTNATNNTNMNLSANEETNHLQPTSGQQSNPPLSPSASSVCTLTTPYDSRLISGHYPRIGSFYGSTYSEQNSFYTSGTNPFYSSFGNPYDLKDPNGNGWGALPQSTCYLYDPIYNPYGERYGPMDGVARRKNVTRDSTTTLKAWLSEHRKNPYPTKGEKIMLAIITKMTLTQVSTWFANARRRLKKENKMTWEPRNRCDDNDDDIGSSDEDNDHHNKLDTLNDSDSNANHNNNSNLNQIRGSIRKDLHHISRQYMDPIKDLSESSRCHSMQTTANCAIAPAMNSSLTSCSTTNDNLHHHFNDKCNPINNTSKPKIWSLAETATEDKPKSPLSHNLNHNLNAGMNLGPPPPLHLPVNMHSNPLSPPMAANMTNWCHPPPTHPHSPYGAVNPYASAHYMPSLGRHFTHPTSATSLPPQADTPPQTPPALKLASMQLLGSESGAALTASAVLAAHDHQVNGGAAESAKLITFGTNRGDHHHILRNGNTSPPTHSHQIYGNDFSRTIATNDNICETSSHLFANSINSGLILQTTSQDNHNNSHNNRK